MTPNICVVVMAVGRRGGIRGTLLGDGGGPMEKRSTAENRDWLRGRRRGGTARAAAPHRHDWLACLLACITLFGHYAHAGLVLSIPSSSPCNPRYCVPVVSHIRMLAPKFLALCYLGPEMKESISTLQGGLDIWMDG